VRLRETLRVPLWLKKGSRSLVSFSPEFSSRLSGSSVMQPIWTVAQAQSDVILLHQTQTIKKMKATTIIIAAVLSLQVSFLFADNNEVVSTAKNESSFGTISTLAPVTPGEATFEETTFTNAFAYNVTNLAPVSPVEADFNDNIEVQSLNLSAFAPVTPAEADFE
jgi:hypothetical protein